MGCKDIKTRQARYNSNNNITLNVFGLFHKGATPSE